MQEDAIRALGVVCHDISVRGDRRFGNLGLAKTLTFARSFFCGRPAKKKIFLREPGCGPPIINVLIILTASYATYIYGIFVAVFGALSVLARPCLVDEELIQSRREDELNNGRPERHFLC